MQSSQGYLMVTWLEMHCNADLEIAPHLATDSLHIGISCDGDLPYYGLNVADLEPPSHRLVCLSQSGFMSRKLSSHDRQSCVW